MTSLPPSSSPTPLPDIAATTSATTTTDAATAATTADTTVGNTSGGGDDSGIINDCTSLLQKRHDCYVKHYTIKDLLDTAADGGRGHNIDHTINTAIIQHPSIKYKQCWIPTLKAKRCQSFLLCQQEALEYYKSPSDTYHPEDNPKGPKEKGICSAYDEQYCFGNPQLMKIDLEGNKRTKKALQREKQRKDTFDHHEKSLTRVIASHHKQGTCNIIRKRLNICLKRSAMINNNNT